MTHDDINEAITASLEDRVRAAIKGVLEQVMEEEMAEQLQARHRERTERRRGERNGHYTRGLTTTAGHIEQIRVPRAREIPFLTEVFERYRRMSGSMEEAVLEMYLQGVSTRKVEQITGKLSGTRISKDAVSRIAARFDDAFALPSVEGRSGEGASSTGSGATRTSTSTPPTSRPGGRGRFGTSPFSWRWGSTTRGTARCSPSRRRPGSGRRRGGGCSRGL